MAEPGTKAFSAGRIRAVTIVGLGVMGGSVAKALARRAPGLRLFGVEPDCDSAERAARDGILVAQALDECPLEGGVVVFAVPLDATVALVRDTGTSWRAAALATDVASLKVPVLAAVGRGSRDGGVFVGAHPMCGSERSGYEAARADLFEEADVWLCPLNSEDGADGSQSIRPLPALQRAFAFWTLLGARPKTIVAERHDRLMAWASHLPQLLANALAVSLHEAGLGREALGPGGRDMTRLAGSGPAMWTPLLAAAAAEGAEALRAVEAHIAAIRRMLEAGDIEGIEDVMTRGNRWTATGA